MPRARIRLPEDLKGLTNAEWEQISQQGMGKEDREIVRLHIIEQLPQIDTATELEISGSTVSRRLPYIYDRARTMMKKLRTE